jgi:hypothetical protein
MKAKIHPIVAIVAIVLLVVGVGYALSKAMNTGVVGKTYAPGEVPKNYDTEPDEATRRDAARTGDPDGK